MTTPVRHDLPAAVTAALDDVQAGLPDPDPTLDPAERDLADQVRQYLRTRVRDPLSRALLERPEIVAWCVRRALRPTGPSPSGGEPSLYRRAEPMPEPPPPARTTRRPAGGTRGKKS